MVRTGTAAGVKRGTASPASPKNARENALRVLLAGCARQDHAAFERLYRLTSPKLYALCVKLLRRPELAEEVLQETYVRIWREAPRYDAGRSAPMTWMAVMARNRAIDVLRRRGHEVESLDESMVRDDAPTPAELTEKSAARGALHYCLGQLQRRHRDVILSAFFNGSTHTELSDALALPIGTVKSWIRRGLAELKRCLEQ